MRANLTGLLVGVSLIVLCPAAGQAEEQEREQAPEPDLLEILVAPDHGYRTVGISPDGTRVAWATRAVGKLLLNVRNLDAGDTNSFEIADDKVRLENAPGKAPAELEVVISKVAWAADDRLVVTDSRGRMFLVSPDGTGLMAVMEYEFGMAMDGQSVFKNDWRWLRNVLPMEPDYVLVEASFSHSSRSGLQPAWIRTRNYHWLNIRDGTTIKTVDLDAITGFLLFDQFGRLQGTYRTVASGNWADVRLQHSDETKYRELGSVIDPKILEDYGIRIRPDRTRFTSAVLLEFDFNPDLLFFSSNHGRDTYAIFVADLKNGRVVGPVFASDRFDMTEFTAPAELERLVFVPEKQTLGGVRYQDVWETTAWRLPEFQAVQKVVDQAVADRVNRIFGWDRNLNRFLVHSYTADDPGAVYLLDRTAQKLRRLVTLRSTLDRARLGSTVASWIENREGNPILCYLTVPPGREAGAKPPLMVLFADHPWQRSELDFDPRVQYLAANGFAVLRAHHRGSAGFGLTHLDAARGRFVEVALADVRDVVDSLAEKGVIDGGRVFSIGQEVGAFLALNAVALHSDRFAGAVAIEALTDPTAFRGNERDSGFYDWMAADLKRSSRERVVRSGRELSRQSPIQHADAIHAPVLFISTKELAYGVVPQQTQSMIKALRRGDSRADLLALEPGWNFAELEATTIKAILAFVQSVPASGTDANPVVNE